MAWCWRAYLQGARMDFDFVVIHDGNEVIIISQNMPNTYNLGEGN
jgi:hypothetical protein